MSRNDRLPLDALLEKFAGMAPGGFKTWLSRSFNGDWEVGFAGVQRVPITYGSARSAWGAVYEAVEAVERQPEKETAKESEREPGDGMMAATKHDLEVSQDMLMSLIGDLRKEVDTVRRFFQSR